MHRFLENSQDAVRLNINPINYERMSEPDYSLNNQSEVVIQDGSSESGNKSESKHPTKSKFVTIGLAIAVVLVSAVLIVYILVNSNSDHEKQNCSPNGQNSGSGGDPDNPEPICLTKGCIETAIDIRRSMNLSANPCDNFYEFTCGRYFPEASDTASQFEELVKKYDKILEDRLNMSSRPDEHPVIKYSRAVFQNCLTSRTDIKSGNVGRFIQETLGIPAWPSRKLTQLPGNHLSELIADLDMKFNLEPLFQLNIFQPNILQKFQFKIWEPTFALPLELRSGQDTYISSEVFKIYTEYIEKVLIQFGTPELNLPSTELKQISKEIVRFEQNLFAFANDKQNLTDYDQMTIREMEGLIKIDQNQTMISPKQILNHILQNSNLGPLQVADNVYIFNSANFTQILTLISNTKPEIVYNYLGYRLALELRLVSPYLTNAYNIITYTVPTPVLPFDSRPLCLTFVKRIFQQALSRHPDEVHDKDSQGTSMFGNKVANSIKGIYENIQNQLIGKLPENTELTEGRRLGSEEDLQNIRFCQDNWELSGEQLDQYYAGIYRFEKSYLEQLTSLRNWESIRWYRLYGKFLSNDCDMLSELSAAFYPYERQINVPPRYWIEPSYNEEWPAYLKYSGLGNTIGHEMMHALFAFVPEWIDDPNTYNIVSKNKRTNRRSSNWMKENEYEMEPPQQEHVRTRGSPLKMLEEQSKLSFRYGSRQQTFRSSSCIVKHYEDFELNPEEFPYFGYISGNNDSLPVINGIKTFGENFADIGGLQMAYSAYQSRVQNNIVGEKGLPGLTDYSSDQLFYINYARHFCERRTPLMETEYLIIDEHTPAKFRVLGTLRNNENFAKTWNCPVGSFMNPEEKCRIF